MVIASCVKPQLEQMTGVQSRGERLKQRVVWTENLGAKNIWFLKRLIPSALHVGKRKDALRAFQEDIELCTLKVPGIRL